MTVLTVLYAIAVLYANTSSTYSSGSSSEGKHPTEYGIWRHYSAEKLATDPDEWYTPEELGVILVESTVTEGRFSLLIVDEAKAFPWMRDEEFTPATVQYEDAFYHILFLWVTPGLPDHVRQWQIPIGVALGIGWVFIIGMTLADYVRAKQKG
jgi:hypothetical protein